LHSEVVY